MRITWEVEDGYCGGSAPQYTEVDDSEIGECQTIEGALKIIEDAVQGDFDSKICWAYVGHERMVESVTKLLNKKTE